MELTDLEDIKRLLQKHKQWAKKFLGQNFLVSRSALDKIVNSANIEANDYIWEIGPGLGVLTKELCQKADRVTAIELDKTLLPVLKETVGKYENLEIINDDALQIRPPEIPYKVVANIPYNITSPILNHFLQAENKPLSITMLIQKEVAEKLVKGAPDFSVISLQVYLFGTPQIISIIKSNEFHPAPKVDSAIIHIDIHNLYDNETALKVLKLAKRAFKMGRKKLSNTLADKIETLKILNLQDMRPQHLTIENWISLV